LYSSISLYITGIPQAAASISATRMGAQASAPYRKEIADMHLYALIRSYAHFPFIQQSI
jgi:hypothetical protein